MHALTKFRQYLVGIKFVVKTDHNILKYLLDQKDLSECQQKWVTKVHAFNFDIEYVKGRRILWLMHYRGDPLQVNPPADKWIPSWSLDS
jgi:hypothetical protein